MPVPGYNLNPYFSKGFSRFASKAASPLKPTCPGESLGSVRKYALYNSPTLYPCEKSGLVRNTGWDLVPLLRIGNKFKQYKRF